MHEHCIKCFKSYCDKDSSFVGFGEDSCPSVFCPNLCGIRLHQCKLSEHAEEVCSRAIVKCPNHYGGCRQEILRCKLISHLKKCPAYVITCTAVWERPVILAKKNRRNYFESELDYVAAMRDEKILNDSEQLPLHLILQRRPDGPYTAPSYIREYAANRIPERLSFPLYKRVNDYEPTYEMIDDETEVGIFDFIAECYKFDKPVETSSKRRSIPEWMPPVCCSLCKKRAAKLSFKQELAPSQNEHKESGQAASIVQALNDLKVDNSKSSAPSDDLSSNQLCETCKKSDRKIRLLEYDMKDCEETGYRVKIRCNQNFRREEYAQHYEFSHTNLQAQLNEQIVKRCPLTHAGCIFHSIGLIPSNGSSVKYDVSLENYVVKPATCYSENNSSHVNWLSSLPPELLFQLLDWLDSASLWNLSLTSKHMRGICEQVLQQKGMVIVTWKQFQEQNSSGDSIICWKPMNRAWSFSTHTSTCTDWKLTNSSVEISKHLETCQYNDKPRYRKGSRVDYHIFLDQLNRMKIEGSSINDINDVAGNILHKTFDSQYWDPSRKLKTL